MFFCPQPTSLDFILHQVRCLILVCISKIASIQVDHLLTHSRGKHINETKTSRIPYDDGMLVSWSIHISRRSILNITNHLMNISGKSTMRRSSYCPHYSWDKKGLHTPVSMYTPPLELHHGRANPMRPSLITDREIYYINITDNRRQPYANNRLYHTTV